MYEELDCVGGQQLLLFLAEWVRSFSLECFYRLIQRVQQLFSLMNQIFVADPACAQRHLSLKTYQVSRLGIDVTLMCYAYEWVCTCMPKVRQTTQDQ